MFKYLQILLLCLTASADRLAFIGTNEVGNLEFNVADGEHLRLLKVGRRSNDSNENPLNFSVGHGIETPSHWAFLTKTQHRDPFSVPADTNLLWTESTVVQTNAFEYKQYSIPGVPYSSAIGLGGYDYQVLYGFIPPQPISTNFIAGEVRAPGKTNFFLGITRKLETGERYLGWLELVRPQADAYAPFRFGRAALDFLPDRPIRVGEQPEFPKIQPEVTAESVRLSVPAAYRRYLGTWLLMERAESLDEPVTWEPVDFGGTNVVTLPADSASRFYRLRLGP